MDNMIRAIDNNKSFRIFAVKSTGVVEKARQSHHTAATASAALGRTLTIGLMMGYMMKNDNDKLTVKINGGGPLGTVLVTTNNQGIIKGYVDHPSADVPRKTNGKLDVGSVVGTDGKITVIKDIGLKEPYVGTSDIVTGEIADDLALYYFLSEQTSSAIAAGVLVNTDDSIRAAGGIIVQPLPDISDEGVKALEDLFKNMKSVSSFFDNNRDIEEIVKDIFKDFNVKINEKMPVKFECDCSDERIERVLISIGKEELKKIIEEDKCAEITCNFCNKKYEYNEEQLNKILKSL
ncbi:Hsp33 family molecular chaperone HslO [Sedimentibacter sp. zth1]|uniref:Hsp33 family molecular chaperone HslO n=1 Tax=Sedimentibacter sp. zth1 TaxID=2816908 RepID=UPI001A931597|nr:Hsp33 family molecular chaperone HslO [Sedimentibacter sp. zth1]QSX07125.1 Hsp33 family molecular chaperone HslO [Sedimentibacter sp. zth1]